MNEIAIKLAVLQAPYYSEMELNEKLEEKFIDLQETLLNRTEQNRHKLNPKNVTGIWYLPALTYETGKPHILVRSPLAKGTLERMETDDEIFSFIQNDVTYDFDEDLIAGDDVIIGLQNELLRELEEGRFYTIYDKGRC